MLTRRDMLKSIGAASARVGSFRGFRGRMLQRKKKILFFSKSDTFEHSVIKRPAPGQAFFCGADFYRIWRRRIIWKSWCSKDGRLFDDAKTLSRRLMRLCFIRWGIWRNRGWTSSRA